MEAHVLGIDAGTTGATAMVADTRGNVRGTGYTEYNCLYPHPGWVEQNMEVVWQGISRSIRQAIVSSAIDPKEIRSLGFSSQRGTFVGIDRNWNPLHDAIVWADGRAVEEVEWLAGTLGGERYHQITSAHLAGNWSYGKFKWVMNHRPELYEKAWKFVNGQEYFLHRLGSEEIFTDPSSLTNNGMMDVQRLDWSDELLKVIGLARDKLPAVKTPMRRVGTVSRRAAEETGLTAGTPICAGGGDQQCAAIGAGVIREGLAEITIGTASVMVAHVDRPKPDPGKTIFFGGHAIPHKWDMEGIALSNGACLRWWRDVYGQPEKEASARLGVDPYDLICLEASHAPPGCKGYIFFPFFQGQSAPHYHDHARGGSIGLSLVHDRGMMARAVLEGVAFELRMIVRAMESVLQSPFESLRITGGGAKSGLWMRILADVFGRPVGQLKVPECTTLGAAILGAVGAGVFANIEEAVGSMVHFDKALEPDQPNHRMYSDLFDCFETAFIALRDSGAYEKLRKVADRHWGG
jgi:xylulokinase